MATSTIRKIWDNDCQSPSGSADDLATGWTYCGSGVTNLPTSANYFIQTCLYSTHGVQIAIKRSDGSGYIRTKSSGTWSTWQLIT